MDRPKPMARTAAAIVERKIFIDFERPPPTQNAHNSFNDRVDETLRGGTRRPGEGHATCTPSRPPQPEQAALVEWLRPSAFETLL